MKHAKIVLLCLLPAANFAAGVANAQTMTEAQLLQLAIDRGTCGELSPVRAWYDEKVAGQINVTCEEVTGFVPLVGLAGAGGGLAAAGAGLALIAVASGGGGSTTPSTN